MTGSNFVVRLQTYAEISKKMRLNTCDFTLIQGIARRYLLTLTKPLYLNQDSSDMYLLLKKMHSCPGCEVRVAVGVEIDIIHDSIQHLVSAKQARDHASPTIATQPGKTTENDHSIHESIVYSHNLYIC